MAKIRKKTSKRTPTRLREKVKKKVAEAKKKAKKAAKKDPTWKSKLKKDPGIPNLFPYKEQVLGEMKDAKAKKEEEKRLRREAAKLGEGTSAAAGAMEVDEDEEVEDDDDEYEDEEDEDEEDDDEEEQTHPSLRAHARSLHKLLGSCDIVIQVLDARDPLGTRSPAVEAEVKRKGGKIIGVLNKIDLVPKENVEGWLKHLRQFFPTLPFKSSTQAQRKNLSSSKNRDPSLVPTGSASTSTQPLLQLLKNYARMPSNSSASTAESGPKLNLKTSLTIGVIGFPNVGKSSLINTLKRSRACGVAPTPGFTKEVQEVVLDKGLKILDCPGVVLESGRGGPEQVLRNAIRVEQIEDPVPPVELILNRCKPEHLMMLYNIPAFMTTTEFLIAVARSRGRLKKGGIPDLQGTARSILNDWNTGKIPFYTVPPAQSSTTSTPTPTFNAAQSSMATTSTDLGQAAIVTQFAPAFDLDALFNEADKDALGGLKGGKEMTGVVRMEGGIRTDEMDVVQGGLGGLKLLGEGEGEDEASEDRMEEEDDEAQAAISKPLSVVSLPPKKKVAFASTSSTMAPSQKARLFAEEGGVPQGMVLAKASARKSAKKDKKRKEKMGREGMEIEDDGSAPAVAAASSSGIAVPPVGAPYDFKAFFRSAPQVSAGGGLDEDEEL